MTSRRLLQSLLAGGALALVLAGTAAAQTRNFNVPAGDLKQALDTYVRQSGVQLVYSVDAVRGMRSHGAHGALSADQALTQVLAGAPFTVQRDASGAVAVVRDEPRPQAMGGQAAVSVDELVVTAQKRAEKLIDVPMGVSAIQGEALDKLQLLDFEDLARSVRGLTLESQGPGVTRLVLRGLNSGGIGSTVAVYVDEAPFGSSTAQLNGGLLAGDFDTWDLKRVEVLSGPQGTLYGANSEGGLIKYVTNAPVLGKLSGALEAGDEDVAHGGAGASLKGMVNLPVGDRLAIRLTAYDETMPGYVDNPLSGQKNINGGRKSGGRVSVLLAPDDNTHIRLTADFQDLKTGSSPAVDVDPVTGEPVHGAFGQERYLLQHSDFRYQNYSATIDHDFGWASLTSATSYGVQDVSLPVDFTSVPAVGSLTYGQYLQALFGEPLALGLDEPISLKKFTQEVRLASPSSQRLEWQLGGFYTHETGHLSQTFSAYHLGTQNLATEIPNLETISLDSTYSEIAGFASATYHFNDRFDLQLGGRYSHNHQDAVEAGDGYFFGFVPVKFDAVSTGDVFTYSIAPSYHFDANTMVYARVASGYRPGGPNVLPPLAPADVPRQFDSDSTVNYEAGFRTSQFGGRLSLDVDAFYITWKGIQLLEVIDNTGVNGNAGSAVSEGVEWTVSATPLRGLRLSTNGAYTDARLTSSSPDIVGAAKGDPLPYAPKWSGSIDAEYDWALFNDFQAFVGGNWSYVGARYSTFLDGGAQAPLPSYDRIDLRAGVQNRSWTFELYAKNVNDTRGLTTISGVGAPGGAADVFYIEPRTIGVLISARF